MSYVLSIDLGTSYFKVALFDRGGMLRGLARLPVPKRTDAGRCELEVGDFWNLLGEGVSQACAQAEASPAQIEGLSYSSQANSFLLLDDGNRPLTPLILWPDMRAGKMGARVRQLWEHPAFLDITGLGLSSPEFMAAKLEWFQEHHPALWRATQRIMTMSDLLVHGLTGDAKGDAGTASLLGLYDVRKKQWWPEALQLLGLHETGLSTPALPGILLGHAQGSAAEKLGLNPAIPVVAGSLDHHMAALGAGLGVVAEATDSTGTVLALLRASSLWDPRPGCCMGPAHAGTGYYQLSFSNAGAGVLEAYQREHAPDLTVDQLLSEASASEGGGDGHGAPVRAILEQAAQTLKELADTLFGGAHARRFVATGGGARSDLWLQIKADCLQAEFVVTECPEPACLGAAMLAAAGAGWFDDVEAASTAWTAIRKIFYPRRDKPAALAGGREPLGRVSPG